MVTSTDAILAGHDRRLATLDPLLPERHPLPEPGPDDLPLAVPGGVGLARRDRPDPASLQATWGALDQHRLVPRITGADPAGAMAALLAPWTAQVRGRVTPEDPETEARVAWPSRDTAVAGQFRAHGLMPTAVVAARPAGRPTPPAATGSGASDPRIRPLAPSDLDAAAALWLGVVRWDAQFGAVTERPSTLPGIRAELAAEAGHDPSWAWVAETAGTDPGGTDPGGTVTGLLVVSPPERAGWIAPLTAPAPVAYVACQGVAAGRRGGGTGAALIARAHAALDAAGVAVTLLHYGAMNPLSGPFWHRCGYRPLWTIWEARPASRLVLPGPAR